MQDDGIERDGLMAGDVVLITEAAGEIDESGLARWIRDRSAD